MVDFVDCIAYNGYTEMKGGAQVSKKQLRTTFTEEFIYTMKVEAAKRGVYVNELIEVAVKEYLRKENN